MEPSSASWSSAAYEKYLGKDKENWLNYDSVALIKRGYTFPNFG